ncbi:DUF317 domain-containing protein [Streptomyces vietnamensis]|uniref:DUF317 domain-containing protein n=1 Tax=Streptomyces vietnamensis TaxID=362257 RepID=UPI000A5123B3|nr:DUF317 domain-containing protein [Streptomyces vietnamensis]
MNASATLLPAVLRPAVEDRHWLSSDHWASPVLDLLHALGWTIVDTPEANVHATSPDGRVYVGWLPEGPAAWTLGLVWRVQVQPTEGDAWVQEFGTDTPPRRWPDSSPPSSPTPPAESVSGRHHRPGPLTGIRSRGPATP